MDTPQPIKIGILVSSDRAFKGEYEDISGIAIKEVLSEFIKNPCEFDYRIISDDFAPLQEAMRQMCESHCDLVVTTGGTGPAPRDIIPEVTQSVCEKMLPGFGELMRQVSLKYVPTAILSRQSAGICGKSLILNLPGKPKSIRECLEAVFPAIPYCVDLIGGGYIVANEEVIKAFRPKS
ncbi:molybdopterin adenylyltransferase [Helicobacter sp. 23-1048]